MVDVLDDGSLTESSGGHPSPAAVKGLMPFLRCTDDIVVGVAGFFLRLMSRYLLMSPIQTFAGVPLGLPADQLSFADIRHPICRSAYRWRRERK